MQNDNRKGQIRAAVVFFVIGIMVAVITDRLTSSDREGTLTGVVTRISSDGESLCITADGNQTCGVPQLADESERPALHDRVLAYFYLVPESADGDLRHKAWVAFFPR